MRKAASKLNNGVLKHHLVLALLLVAVGVGITFPKQVNAKSTNSFFYEISKENCRPTESFEVAVVYDGIEKEVGAFSVKLEYDNSLFKLTKTRNGDAVKSGHSQTETTDGLALSVFTSKGAQILKGETFVYSFEVLSGALSSGTEIKLATEQIVDGHGARIEDDYRESLPFFVMPQKSEDSLLYQLKPSNGELNPSFKSNIFTYNMTVPFEVKSLEFEHIPSENATSRVNRKNLGAGGSEIDFVFTVTAENGVTVSKYTVTVHRSEKIIEEKAEATPKPTSSKKSISSSTKSSKSQSKSSSKTVSIKSKTSTSKADNIGTNMAGNTINNITPVVNINSGNYPEFLLGAVITIACLAVGVVIGVGVRKHRFNDKEKKEDNEDEDDN